MLLTVADDKHAHLYLQGRRRLELPSNTPVTLTFTAYCPFTDDDEVATRRQITFTHQTRFDKFTNNFMKQKLKANITSPY